jgi:glutamate 5-kinase
VGAVPIVNENDVVAVEEIEGVKIGDNDNLSALVANLVDADLLVLLTDQAGLFTTDPRLDPDSRLIQRVERIDGEIEQLAGESSELGVGGMTTKIQAARLATAGGTHVVIADGREKDILVRLTEGEALGTLFPATVDRLESRKRWMLAGLSLKGSIVVDAGAARALREEKRSLLPAGIRRVEGPFERGDAIAICDSEGQRIACGIASYGSSDIETIHGLRSERIEEVLGYQYGAEVVHRDNLVLL